MAKITLYHQYLYAGGQWTKEIIPDLRFTPQPTTNINVMAHALAKTKTDFTSLAKVSLNNLYKMTKGNAMKLYPSQR